MTEGLQGVLIGGAIGIIGSIVVETIRARYQKHATCRQNRIYIFEKRKAALVSVLEHFRKLQFEIATWDTRREAKFTLTQWEYLTGFMPHLAILPEPFPSFVRARIDLLAQHLWGKNGANPHTDAPTDGAISIQIFAKPITEVIKRATDEISLIDAQIMGFEKSSKLEHAWDVCNKINGNGQ